jgi:50S ribosomal subunit-associated GTPase HflX
VDTPLDIDEIEGSDYPIIPISAKHGLNCEKLLETLTYMARKMLGKDKINLAFPLEEYSRRTQWLKEVAGVKSPEYTVATDQRTGKNTCQMQVWLADDTYSRYQSFFNEQAKGAKGMPSQEWVLRKFGNYKW